MKKISIIRPFPATLLILLVPVFGNQFIEGWNWDLGDFIIMGTLIFSFGLFIEIVNIKVKKKNHKIALIIATILAFLYIWAELAVGIFTNLGS